MTTQQTTDATTEPANAGDRCAQLEQEVSSLRGAVTWIDGLTQEAASTLEALAKGAQAILQTGDNVVDVYRLLGTIADVAANHMNTVNCEAETVGANYRSDNDRSELAATLINRRWRVETEVEA